MNNKLLFLTKISLNKKIKTKWFFIANLIFAILIIGLINIDSIIKVFGGDFNEENEILVIDKVGVFEEFNNTYTLYSKYVEDYENVIISKYEDDYSKGIELVEDNDKKILLIIEEDLDNYIKAEIVSNEKVGTITNTLISTCLSSIRSGIVLNEYNITREMYEDINNSVSISNTILSEDNTDDNMMISSVMQIITLPVFMLIIFLVQMIGAEINEEKTTKSMEIIISNVSPKTHFISKIIAANVFVLIQGFLLLLFVSIGVLIRYLMVGSIIPDLGSSVTSVIGDLSFSSIVDSIAIILPIVIFMLILTFIAYSLFAGILASMTTNLEDFQQLQAPIVITSLIGYYLSIMAGMFKGSIFIKVMSYIPFISALLSPTLYILGDIGIIDLSISILLLILVIYLLVKYGLRIYKVGILNYSQSGLWKKMFKAMGGKK